MPSIDRRHFLATTGLALAGSVGVRRVWGRPDPERVESVTPSPEWHHPRRDAGNTASTDDPGPRTDGEVSWRRSVSVDDAEAIVQWGETLLVPGRNELVALESASGERLWTVTATDRRRSPRTSPRVRDGTVYLALGIYVYAIDLETRRPRWRYRVDGSVGTTALAGNVLCFHSFADGDALLFALDAENGAERWRVPGRWYDAGASADLLVATRRPEDGAFELVGIDLETGKTAWTNSVEDVSLSLGSTIVAREDRVLVTGRHGIAILEASSGEVTTVLEGVPDAGNVAIGPDGDWVYATGPREGIVTGITLDGDERWTLEADVESGIAVGADTVYVATDEGVLALDAEDGGQRFAVGPEVDSLSLPSRSRVETTPLISGDAVYHRLGDTVYEVSQS